MKTGIQTFVFAFFLTLAPTFLAAVCPSTSASNTNATGHNCPDGTITATVNQTSTTEPGWTCVLYAANGNGIASFGGGVGNVSHTFTNLYAGNYFIRTFNNNNQCADIPITINQPDCNAAINATFTDATSHNCFDGTITIAPSGNCQGAGFIYYKLVNNTYQGIASLGLPVNGTHTLNNLYAGDYAVTMAENGPFGCRDTVYLTIGQPACDVAINASVTDVTAHNCVDGAITIAPSGNCQGAGFIYYKLVNNTYQGIASLGLPVNGTHTLNNLYAGDYAVTMAENGPFGCRDTVYLTIGQPACDVAINASVTDVTAHNCVDGTITINPTGNCQGAGFIYYKLVNNTYQGIASLGLPVNGTHTLNNLYAGSYAVTMAEGGLFGCRDTTYVTITQPDCDVAINASVTNVTAHNCFDGAITIAPSGNCQSAGFVYYQKVNGTYQGIASLSLPVNGTHTLTNRYAGEYAVVMTENGPFGCLDTAYVVINQPPCNVAINASVVPVTGANCQDGKINIAPTGNCQGAGYVYYKKVNGSYQGIASLSLSPGQMHTLTNLYYGEYAITMVENGPFGCRDTDYVVIELPVCTANLNETFSHPTAHNCANGSLSVAPQGICQSVGIIYYKKVGASYQGIASTSVPVNGTHTLTGQFAGDYAITLVENGPFACRDTAYITLTQPPCNLNLNGSTAQITAKNCVNGSITVAPTGNNCFGGNAVLFKNGQGIASVGIPVSGSHTFQNLGAGSYRVDFQENGPFGCFAQYFSTITEPGCNIALNISGQNPSGPACPTGAIGIQPTQVCNNGVATLLKSINGNFTVQATANLAPGQVHAFGNLTAGNYRVDFQENGANGCFGQAVITLTAPACAVNLNLNSVAPTGNNCQNGSISIAPGPFCGNGSASLFKNVGGSFVLQTSVALSSGQSHTFPNLTAGTYRVDFQETVPGGCTASQTLTLGTGGACNVNLHLTATNLAKRHCNTGKIRIAPTGICQAWSADLMKIVNGSATLLATGSGTPGGFFIFQNLSAGSYLVNFQEIGDNGCSAIQAVTLTQPGCAAIAITTTVVKQPTLGCANGQVKLKANGTCAAGNLTLTDGTGQTYTGVPAGTATLFTGLVAGAYSAIFEETGVENPCTTTVSVNLASACNFGISLTGQTANTGCDGLLRATLTGLSCTANAATLTFVNSGTSASGALNGIGNNTFVASVPPGTYIVTASIGTCTATATATVNSQNCFLGLSAALNAASTGCDNGRINFSTTTCGTVLYQLVNAAGTVVQSLSLPGGQPGSFSGIAYGNYKVRAVQGACVDSLLLSVTTACPTPANGNYTSAEPDTVFLAWDAVPCATGYTLRYRPQGTSTFTTVQINTNTPNRTLVGLLPNTTYEWRIRSKCGTFVSPFSATMLFTTPGDGGSQKAGKTLENIDNQSGSAARGETFVGSPEPEIFPNPATTDIRLEWEIEAPAVQLAIFDASGKQIVLRQLPSDGKMLQALLDISDLAPGVFLVHLKTEKESKALRFVKQ